MTTQTASTASSTPPRYSSFDVTTGKAVTLDMDLYSPGSDPELNLQWHLQYLGNIGKVWQDYTGRGVSVGIYDSGVQSAHWDLGGNVDKSKELVYDGEVQSGEPVDWGDPSHGTCVAGLIGAERNGEGGVGIAWDVKMTGVSIFDDRLHAWYDLPWAIAQGSRFDILSNSWVYPDNPVNSQSSRGTSTGWWGNAVAALDHIASTGRGGLGTIFVKGAGNDAQENQTDVHNIDRHAITVSAYRQVDGVASSYSNSGPYLLVAAPSDDYGDLAGTGQVTTDLLGSRGMSSQDYTDDFGGTSGATPIVTGVVALMLDANPYLGWRDVRNIVAASAKMPIAFETGPVQFMRSNGWAADMNERSFQLSGQDAHWNGGAMHYSNDYGYGAVDAYSAARMAEVWSLFGAAKVSSNEVHAQVQADVGLTASSGTANVDPTRMQKFGDFINAPVRFQFEVRQALDLEHVDLTLDFRDKVTILKDGQPVSDAEFYNSLSDAQFKLIAPDGSYAFSTHDRGVSKVDSAAQQFMLGFSGFHGVASQGIWTLEFSTWSASDWHDGQPVVRATDLTIDSIAMDLYGSTPSNDDVYSYTNEFFKMAAISGEQGRKMLVDGNGGTDWINAAAVSKDIVLSLVGGQSTSFGGEKAFTIDRASVIENAVTGDGNDTLTGNRYANILLGMRGNDVLNGGMGDDILSGGSGSNRFVFDARSGHDTIVDWARSDILQTVKALKGVGSDGTLTVGANATLLLDGTANGNTVLLTDHSGAKLQSLGQKDGYYWYAYVADAAADAGKVVREFAASPAAAAAGAVDHIVATSANDNDASTGAHDAGTSAHALDTGFYLYDAMAGSMNGGVQLFA